MKNSTIPRGYRLKASTHILIKKVQAELNFSQDKVIARAVKLYYNTMRAAGDAKNMNGNKNPDEMNQGKLNK